MTISEYIFEMIKIRGLSQKDFSDKTGISQSTISDWKRKKTNPSADKILIICDVLGVTPYELLQCREKKGKGDVPAYIICEEGTDAYDIMSTYNRLKKSDKDKLMGYLEALRDR